MKQHQTISNTTKQQAIPQHPNNIQVTTTKIQHNTNPTPKNQSTKITIKSPNPQKHKKHQTQTSIAK